MFGSIRYVKKVIIYEHGSTVLVLLSGSCFKSLLAHLIVYHIPGGNIYPTDSNTLSHHPMIDTKHFISPVRTCAPGRAAPSWPGCLSLLALMSSLHRFAAELL